MSTDVVVYGASGLVGRHVCADLERGGVVFVRAQRTTEAFAGASLVVNCAGPIAEIGDHVLVEALRAGCDYIDLGGDQAVMHEMYERHDSSARHAGKVVVPGCAIDCLLGDLAASWAAMHVCGIDDDGDAVRSEPSARLADDRPLDEIAISYIFDDLVLSPGTQKALFGALGSRGLVWHRDRWEQARVMRRRVNAGPAFGGERDAVSFPGSDVLTIPRHVAARSVETFVSTTRSAAAATAMRLVARALPLVPKRAGGLLAAYSPPEDDYARTRFAVVAQAKRGFAAAQVVVRGTDIYRTTGAIAAWVARALVGRGAGPVGMRAPAELFRPEPALQEIATAAGLAIEPSFR